MIDDSLPIISHIGWDPPGDWLVWDPSAPQSVYEQAPMIAAGLARQALVAAIDAFQSLVHRDLPGTVQAAMWLPDQATCEPVAMASLRLTSPEPTGRWTPHEALAIAGSRPPAPRGHKIVDLAATPVACPAGDAVLRILDTAPRWTRRVTREWTWIILPPGTHEIVLLQIQCTSPAEFDRVLDLGCDIADTIRVELAEA